MIPGTDADAGARAWIVPPALRPRDVVRVIAPSGPFDPTLVWRGLGWLAERYRVRFDRGIFDRRGYLAGDDARRQGELEAALDEPDVAAILCSRGGYGASRYVHRIDFGKLRSEPRWLVGFSDVTALHVEAARARVATLHAVNVTGVGRGDAVARSEFVLALERPLDVRVHDQLTTHVAGVARGRLFGGNLTMLHACAAANRLSVPPGAILFLEDVTERPYRIDRMLATLLAGGHFKHVAGVMLGDFTDCVAGKDGVTVDDVFGELLVPLGVPLAAGLSAGHALRNVPLPLGLPALLTAEPHGASLTCGTNVNSPI